MRFVLIFSLLVSANAWAATSVTLKEALEKAGVSNPGLKSSEFDYKASLGSLQSEQSVFLPTFGIEGGYQKFDSESQKISGTFGHVFGEYKIDLGGSGYFQYKAASVEADIAHLKNEQVQRQLQWNIETKFSRALYLQESIKLYKTALEQNISFAQAAKKKKASGLASDADVLEFDLNESILRSDLEEIQSDYNEALNDLRVALGISYAEPIELKGSLDHFHIQGSFDEIKSRIQASSYKGQIAGLEAKRANYLQSASYGGLLPEVSLGATFGRRGIDEPEGPEQTYYVIARWELFSGFKDVGNYKKALAMEQKAEFEKRQSEINLPGELETEYKKFLALQNRVDLESQNRERSRSYLNTVMKEYHRGVKNSADLKSASMQLLETSLRDLKFRYEGIKQKEVLQALTGNNVRFEVYSTAHKIN
jgi:outer membrane protein TolC